MLKFNHSNHNKGADTTTWDNKSLIANKKKRNNENKKIMCKYCNTLD